MIHGAKVLTIHRGRVDNWKARLLGAKQAPIQEMINLRRMPSAEVLLALSPKKALGVKSHSSGRAVYSALKLVSGAPQTSSFTKRRSLFCLVSSATQNSRSCGYPVKVLSMLTSRSVALDVCLGCRSTIYCSQPATSDLPPEATRVPWH
jgi:hypothetical protein